MSVEVEPLVERPALAVTPSVPATALEGPERPSMGLAGRLAILTAALALLLVVGATEISLSWSARSRSEDFRDDLMSLANTLSALLTDLASLSPTDLHTEYADLVSTSKEIDWNAVLEPVGLSLHRDMSSYLGVQLHQAKGEGVLIDAVETGSAAARCGLQAGDTLLAIDGDIVTFETFKALLAHRVPRSPIQLTVLRGGNQIKLLGDSGVQYSHYQLIPSRQNADVTTAMTLFLPTTAKSPIVP